MIKSVQSSLNKALKQLHAEKSRIERQISALSAALGHLGGKAAAGPRGRRKRSKMSASQKRAVSVRMKAYWAKRRAAKGK